MLAAAVVRAVTGQLHCCSVGAAQAAGNAVQGDCGRRTKFDVGEAAVVAGDEDTGCAGVAEGAGGTVGTKSRRKWLR